MFIEVDGSVYLSLHDVVVDKTVTVSVDPLVNLDYDLNGEIIGIEVVP